MRGAANAKQDREIPMGQVHSMGLSTSKSHRGSVCIAGILGCLLGLVIIDGFTEVFHHCCRYLADLSAVALLIGE